ncbi:MAG: leucine-rich repeat domain-containing protein [Ruminococcus flavefaciens]|nr:leucine-rich repeat domain-containing protein [Ruminococcus flavefaciens]MCM1229591.1 leucine-rich repeat domain-containing protein [Ruminococcus flavefaciens]
MEINDFIQIVCPKCKALLFAEKKLESWYCGYCGEKVVIETTKDDKPENTAPVLTGDIFLCDKNTLVKYAGHDEDVDVPENITKIDSGAFKGNTDIKTVNIPDSVTEIAGSAFEDCTALMSVRLPSHIRKIAYKTFSGCDSLKSLTIPENVESLLNDALFCKIDEIVFESSETTWELESEYAGPSFEVCRKSSGDGVKKIYFKNNVYEASEVYRFKSVSAYLRSQGLCTKCGGKFGGLFNKCKGCGAKKEQ